MPVFAPPITDGHLSSWQALVKGTKGLTRHALETLHALVQQHKAHHQPSEAPPLASQTYDVGVAHHIPLHHDTKTAVAEHLPTDEEMKVYDELFGKLQGELRDMAYHLLWYALELKKGREPITKDKLVPHQTAPTSGAA